MRRMRHDLRATFDLMEGSRMTAHIIESLSADPEALRTLLELLEKQRGLFARLRELSERQTALVNDAAADALLTLLAERQSLIDELMAANEALEPYRRNWTKLYADLPEPQRQHVGTLLREVQQSLGAILEQDERDRQTLQSRQGRIGIELQGMARAGSAVQAYRNAAHQAQARFTDSRG